MPKKRDKDGVEFYRAKCRQLQKEVQQLRRQLEKQQRPQDEELATDSEDTRPMLKQKQPCQECGKGFLEEFEIMDKVYGTCNTCGHRERLK